MIWRYSSSAGVACSSDTRPSVLRTGRHPGRPPGGMYSGPVQLGRDTRVIVTGSSRGIGRCLAEELASRACTVGLVARSADELEKLATELRARGGEAESLPADVSKRDQIDAAVAQFPERHKSL